MMRVWHLILILASVSLAACGESNLRQLQKPGEGPDEFLIVPGEPLQQPENFSDLPEPTPGGVNRTDQQPLNDSVAALGGTRGTNVNGGIPTGDSGIVTYASRLGRDGTIRQTLAEEDEAFRKRRGRFLQIRLVKRDNYALVYKRETLDASAENQRWRRAGVRTPTAPPR